MAPLEALAAATSRTAVCFGLTDRGWIKPGLRADLLVVDGRPDERIADAQRMLRAQTEKVVAEIQARLPQWTR